MTLEILVQEVAKLRKENRELREKLRLLEADNRQLRARNKELERRLQLSSSTSSKPPSSDGLRAKPRNKSLREKSECASGGQKGHKGNTLMQVLNPDKTVSLQLSSCPECATLLKNTPIKAYAKRQVVDIPPVQSIVTEYQAEIKKCPCCKKNVTAAFPEHVKAPVQYGRRIQAFVVYLQNQQLLPEKRLQMLCKDLFNLPISAATITKIVETFSKKLAPHLRDIDIFLRGSPVKHVDETGFRIKGKTRWLHVLCNNFATLYRASLKRGDILEDLEKVVVHDHFSSYKKMTHAIHAFCNAHHLRELKALIEIDKEIWAKKMWDLLRLASKLKKLFGGSLPKKIADRQSVLYDRYIAQGFQYHESMPLLPRKTGTRRIKRRPGHNLLLRLQKEKEGTLRFFHEEFVPFTNNQAEQDIRMMKVKQKISGGFRTMQGAQIFSGIRSFLSTVRKQGYDILESITSVIHGRMKLTLVA